MERTAVRQKTVVVVLAAVVAMILGAGALLATPQTALAVNVPGKTTVTLAKVNPQKIKVTCAKKTYATGYQVKISTKSTFPKTSATKTMTGTARIKYPTGLKAGTKYYVKARAYRVYKGKKHYGTWSAKKYITTYKTKGLVNGWHYYIGSTDCWCNAPKVYGARIVYEGSSKTPVAPAKINGVDVVFVDCQGRNLTSVDVTKCTKLKRLDASYNRLTKLNLTKNPNLYYLNCDDNRLTTLSLKANTALRYLNCSSEDPNEPANNIKSLDLSANTKLIRVDAQGNPNLTSLNLNCAATLTTLFASNTNLYDTLDFTAYKKLEDVDLSYCEGLTNVKLKGEKVKYVTLQGTGIEQIWLDACPNLDSLYVGERRNLGYIELDNCAKLTDLSVGDCQTLFHLDVSNCISLERLYISGSGITELDLSNCPKMTEDGLNYDPEMTTVIWP